MLWRRALTVSHSSVFFVTYRMPKCWLCSMAGLQCWSNWLCRMHKRRFSWWQGQRRTSLVMGNGLVGGVVHYSNMCIQSLPDCVNVCPAPLVMTAWYLVLAGASAMRNLSASLNSAAASRPCFKASRATSGTRHAGLAHCVHALHSHALKTTSMTDCAQSAMPRLIDGQGAATCLSTRKVSDELRKNLAMESKTLHAFYNTCASPHRSLSLSSL